MDEFLKMDIFFVVTTLVIIVLGALAAYVLWRIERILKQVEHITEQAAIESDLIRQDMSELRRDIRKGGSRFAAFAKFLSGLTEHKKKKHHGKKKIKSGAQSLSREQ
jgi:hypothetical protein